MLGLGYVGLPTGIGLATGGAKVTGVDVSERRLQDIREGSVDLAAGERERLQSALELNELMLTSSPGALEAGGRGDDLRPDARSTTGSSPTCGMLRAACATVVAHARRDQVIVLTSTTYVGSTQELLAQPLAERGLRPGREVFVAFSPERIDPGNGHWDQRDVPRVVGGVTDRCAREAAEIVGTVVGRRAPRLVVRGGRDDQALREHLPRGQHRVGERDGGREPRFRARPDGDHPRRGDEAVRDPDVLAGGRRRAGTASRATRTTCCAGCASGAPMRRSRAVR